MEIHSFTMEILSLAWAAIVEMLEFIWLLTWVKKQWFIGHCISLEIFMLLLFCAAEHIIYLICIKSHEIW